MEQWHLFRKQSRGDKLAAWLLTCQWGPHASYGLSTLSLKLGLQLRLPLCFLYPPD